MIVQPAAERSAVASLSWLATPNLAKLDQWFFDHQQTLSRDVVKKAAEEQAGITDFDARYEAALQTVRADANLGKQVDVSSTPTIFINGRKIPCCPPPAYYDAFIDIELKKAKSN